MTTTKKSKAFDCLAFKDQVQSEIYEETKDMSHEEEIAYFREAVQKGPFAELWRKLAAQREQASAGPKRST